MGSKAWVVAVDMGYGHARAAEALASLAPEGKVIFANDYPEMPLGDRLFWRRSEKFYTAISRMKSRGILGRWLFNAFDYFQKIDEYEPGRKKPTPTFQLRNIYRSIRRGWGKDLIERLSKRPLPLVTPFFTVAFMAEEWHYPGEIYAVVTDTDVSRAWAPLNPQKSRIRYFASTLRTVDRLESYGVAKEKIILTGFPLPDELVGKNSAIAERALKRRLKVLDPWGRHDTKLAKKNLNLAPPPPHLVFAVGGAGAQTDIGVQLLKNLAEDLKSNRIILHLVAGVSSAASDAFEAAALKFGLSDLMGHSLFILHTKTKQEYFREFNQTLKVADILWTKPSELSFFTALGLPILIAPPIGAQELENRKWLLSLGTGMDSLSAQDAHIWLFDLIYSGRFAELAENGFREAERLGVENIRRALAHAGQKSSHAK